MTGCTDKKAEHQAARGVQDYFNGDYARAINAFTPLAEKPDENYVLNNLRLGSAALAAYDLGTAESAFLKAWETINAGGVNSGGRSVAAVVIDEKLKIWKGEPYERALASFDLGLVYLLKNDFNNARAAFENSLFKLRDYADAKDEKKNYTEQESTFAIAHILLGRCWQRLSREDLARRAFDTAAKLRPDLAQLADYDRQLGTNVMLVVEYGFGPRKRSEFDGTAVAFSPTLQNAGQLPQPRVIVDGRDFSLGDAAVPTIDTVAMAHDRRWQSIDTIRVTKDVVGAGMIVGGAGYGLYRINQGNVRPEDVAIAGGLIALGALMRASSNVDLRQWEMAPRTIFLLPLTLPPGRHDVTVTFPATDVTQSWRGLVVPERGDVTYYFRMNRYLPGPFVWPPPAPQLNVTANVQ
ncbi:MAG: tetratricopeptide repeat protein [Tepidisphaeraceae bacterium]